MNQIVDVMKALSNETRLRILVVLYHKELCVCELQGILGKSQPQISKQLAILRDLKLICDTKRDKYVYYVLCDNVLLKHCIEAVLENKEVEPQLHSDLQKCKSSHIYREGTC